MTLVQLPAALNEIVKYIAQHGVSTFELALPWSNNPYLEIYFPDDWGDTYDAIQVDENGKAQVVTRLYDPPDDPNQAENLRVS
mgnify:FL=1